MARMRQQGWIVGLPVLVLLGLAACGGGGGGSGTPAPTTPPTPAPPSTGISWTSGVYAASSSFAAQCQVPRSGTNPATGRAYPDVAGSLLAEKHFLRSWTHELYLWFDEVADRDPASVADVRAYFDLLKTPVVLPSGKDKDQFHFAYDTAQYRALAQSGTSNGYGISWFVVSGSPPRRVVVQYVQPGSPAALAGVGRGAELRTVDGINVVADTTNSGITAINNGAFAPAAGSVHQLQFADRGTGALRNASLTAGPVTFDAVPLASVLSTSTGKVGYLLFNDHTAAAEQVLIQSVQQLAAQSVQDLVLDLRYNGGGYLDIASELAYMIAGPARTAGQTFERLQFNSQHPTTNPVTGESLAPIPFYATAQGFSASAGTVLPTLNLPRVYVLTSKDTCSASESIMNGLRGAGVQVLQIGGTTCGKPYGFYPRDNCGTTYFSVQFRGVNQLGFGDYAEGFSATRTTGPAQANLPGCAASDDYSRDLGDANEGQLRVALAYREGGFCIAAAEAPAEAAAPTLPAGPELVLPREPWRGNRFLR